MNWDEQVFPLPQVLEQMLPLPLVREQEQVLPLLLVLVLEQELVMFFLPTNLQI
jgi:hypothetical protein